MVDLVTSTRMPPGMRRSYCVGVGAAATGFPVVTGHGRLSDTYVDPDPSDRLSAEDFTDNEHLRPQPVPLRGIDRARWSLGCGWPAPGCSIEPPGPPRTG